MCVCIYVYAHVTVDACGGHKRELDPLELDLQEVVDSLVWVLGNKFWPIVGGLLTLNH